MPSFDLDFMHLLIGDRKLRAEQSRIVEDHQRQLEHVQRTSEANIERTRKRLEAEKAELQKIAEADAERTRKRMEAEIADLQRNINKLETDLTKERTSFSTDFINF
jgi:intracellular protein transport protein USO1